MVYGPTVFHDISNLYSGGMKKNIIGKYWPHVGNRREQNKIRDSLKWIEHHQDHEHLYVSKSCSFRGRYFKMSCIPVRCGLGMEMQV